MNKILKHKYKILIFLLIVVGIFWFVRHSLEHGGEYMFDMKEINGVSDNNPYGIRNDVYTYLDSEINKWATQYPEFKDPKVRFMILNYEKAELMSIKYFSSKSKALEAGYQQLMIMDCLHMNSKNTGKFISDLISHYGRTSQMDKIILKSKDHKLISEIVDNYFDGKTLNPDHRSPEDHPELCDRYETRVLKDEEFTTRDPRIILKRSTDE
jgi:hypothetical protein